MLIVRIQREQKKLKIKKQPNQKGYGPSKIKHKIIYLLQVTDVLFGHGNQALTPCFSMQGNGCSEGGSDHKLAKVTSKQIQKWREKKPKNPKHGTEA